MQKINNILSEIFENEVKILFPIHGGMMNQSFVVESKNKKYVFYVPGNNANEMVDRELEKYNIDLAYHLGITSKNVYFDTEKGIKVNRYIEGNSLNNINQYDYAKIAIMLRKLHQGGSLTYTDYMPFEKLNMYEKERIAYQKSVDVYYKIIKDVLIKEKSYLTSDKLVLSHNDFQKSNIVQDLEDNYWLIDFEFMANNYDLYDVACFANNDIEDGEKLLVEYKHGNPNKDDYKKFYLWRMFLSLQWFNVAIIKHNKGEGEIHNIDFMSVASHFIENAKIALKKYQNL